MLSVFELLRKARDQLNRIRFPRGFFDIRRFWFLPYMFPFVFPAHVTKVISLDKPSGLYSSPSEFEDTNPKFVPPEESLDDQGCIPFHLRLEVLRLHQFLELDIVLEPTHRAPRVRGAPGEGAPRVRGAR